MTTKQLERKQNELESLITDHRVVRIQYTEAEHFTVKVNRDMPEWGVKAGEIVHLYKSSYEGFYYILTWDAVWTRHACSCRGYEMRHHCKHADAVNEICRARYHQRRKATPVRVQAERKLVRANIRETARLGAYEGFSLLA